MSTVGIKMLKSAHFTFIFKTDIFIILHVVCIGVSIINFDEAIFRDIRNK